MAYFILLIQIVALFQIIALMAVLNIWFERKVSALIQNRVGANRAGSFIYPQDVAARLEGMLPKWLIKVLRYVVLPPVLKVVRAFGILGVINTMMCDSLKAIFKEDFIPKGTSKFLHSLAPFMAVFPVFVAFAVIPMAPEFTLGGYLIRFQVAPVEGGILVIFAMGSLAVYGVTIAGWVSNNKFAMFGALRAAAQMISYELAMGVSFITMILLYGTLDLYTMITAQAGNNPHLPFLPNWGIFYQPICFLVIMVVGMAETKRAPFDLPEAESELTAGYFTEYSGMKFLLFWFGEFAEIALFAFILAILFFGGWNIPYFELPAGTWWVAVIGHLVLMTKVVVLCVLQVIIRWTLPRFRFDQLMNLGWKVLLPLSLVNIMVSAAAKLLW